MNAAPYMPTVDSDDDTQRKCFEMARNIARTDRSVAIVTPGRLIVPIAVPEAGSMAAQMVAAIEQIVPATPSQRITVIAFSNVVMQGALNAKQINELIPFLGYLIGMIYIGHSVVVFEGHPSALKIACQSVDLLIVDQAMVTHLQSDWVPTVRGVMNTPSILVFGRDGSIGLIDTQTPMDTATFTYHAGMSSANAEEKPKAEPKPKKRRWWWFN